MDAIQTVVLRQSDTLQPPFRFAQHPNHQPARGSSGFCFAYNDTGKCGCVACYGAEAKKTQLTSQLWYKDTAGHMEGTTINAGNLGLVERGRHLAESREVDMMDRLHVDLFL